MTNTLYTNGSTFRSTQDMVCVECYKCHVLFAMTEEHNDLCLSRGYNFFCPNGHDQRYTESKEQKLQKELDIQKQVAERERKWRESAEADTKHERRSKNAYRGQLTKIKKRVKNGVCPCCTRHFTNLERHMATKHPEFTTEVAP